MKYIFFVLFFSVLIGCSVKKNTFFSRSFHGMTTKFNVVYNGQVSLDRGVENLKINYKDNFWKRLPVEELILIEDDGLDTISKADNKDFDRSEAKATKAIQKHSMIIDGKERNAQIDRAYLLLGMSRYYEQRFFPALEAFNYVLYKSDHNLVFLEAKFWREKTSLHLGNDATTIQNINLLLQYDGFGDQILANGNALLAEAYLNMEKPETAIIKLETALKYSKKNSEKSRYRYILGQLYEDTEKKDSAMYYYQAVINMKRKAARKYVANAYSKKAIYFDFTKNDSVKFIKKYKRFIENPENSDYEGILNHGLAIFYSNANKLELAKKYYMASLKAKTDDSYLFASNYRNLGDIAFEKTKYQEAAKYYDSTLTHLEKNTREYFTVKRKRKNLDQVTFLEDITQNYGKILKIATLPDDKQIEYFRDSIERLKKEDKLRNQLEQSKKNSKDNFNDSAVDNVFSNSFAPQPSAVGQKENVFYFYNPTTVAWGKLEFKKVWGNIQPGDNWKNPQTKTADNIPDIEVLVEENKDNKKIVSAKDTTKTEEVNEKYNVGYYLNQLPKTKKEIDSLKREYDFSNYQLGIIYEDKFKDHELAAKKLEILLSSNPEKKWILPAQYNLYKIYKNIDNEKAESKKQLILSEYSDSYYAHLIENNNSDENASTEITPEKEYKKWYQLYSEKKYLLVLENIDAIIIRYSGNPIAPKFALLKANCMAKLYGIAAYKKALKVVSKTYPNTIEGVTAKEMLDNHISKIETKTITDEDSSKWRIIFKVLSKDETGIFEIMEIITKFAQESAKELIKISLDNYNDTESFITIRGITLKEYADEILEILKTDKNYLVKANGIIISSKNYESVQINKNLEEYLK